MRSAINCIFILLGCITVAGLPSGQAAAELPPEILADRYLVKAERLMAEKNYHGALNAMNDIVALQSKHNLNLPEQFHFKYAQVAFSAGAYSTVIDAIERYLKGVGKKAESYNEALALLDKAEQSMPIEPEMVVIPSGRFRMGCLSGLDCEWTTELVRTVTIRSFELSKYEITFNEYDRFATATGRERPHDKGWGRGRRPVVNVSADDAMAYASWLAEQTGRHYRLPSEAEWEYAARAGTTTRYSWGNEIGHNRANCDGCGSRWDYVKTAPVGSFAANTWGLHDMHGNVEEWVQDCSSVPKEIPVDGSPQRDCTDPTNHVLRGGGYYVPSKHVRSASYNTNYSVRGKRDTGFRVARSVSP